MGIEAKYTFLGIPIGKRSIEPGSIEKLRRPFALGMESAATNRGKGSTDSVMVYKDDEDELTITRSTTKGESGTYKAAEVNAANIERRVRMAFGLTKKSIIYESD